MAFITAFETLIESKVDDSSERLCFLDQYTSGKEKELIKGFFTNERRRFVQRLDGF